MNSDYVSAFYASDELNQLELEHDLLRYKFDGWSIWPLFRFQAGLILNKLPLGGQSRAKYSYQLKLFLADLIAWFSIRPTKYLVKTYTSGLLELTANGYKDIWFDDLLDDIGGGLKIEGVNNRLFAKRRQRALHPSAMSVSTLHLFAKILSNIMLSQSEIDRLASSFNAQISPVGTLAAILTPGFIASRIRIFYWQKLLYKQLLKKVQPHFVFVADPGEFALVAASKECHITVIEFQHGFIDYRTHYNYSWTGYAGIYKKHLPLPDKLFLYGDYWKQNLERNSFWGDSLRVVGSPRIDSFRRRKALQRTTVPVLLYTTQGIDALNAASFLEAFLNLLRPHGSLTLYIKMHPVYDADLSVYRDRFGRDSFVHILLGNDDPSTFELLAQADLHLSISSTCHYDAIALGVPTVILPLSTYEIVMQLHENGHASYVKDPVELAELVLRLGNYEVPQSVSEYYFKSNALNNIKHELGLIA